MQRLLATLAVALFFLPWQAPIAAETAVQQAIRAASESPRVSAPGFEFAIAAPDLVSAIYTNRDYVPAWSETDKVRSLLAAVRRSYDDGLSPLDYHVEQIEAWERIVGADQQLPAQERAAFDVVLTDSLVRLVSHLRYGKTGHETGWQFDESSAPTVFGEIIAADNLAEAVYAVAPKDRGYAGLRTQLERHREIAATGGWPTVPSGPTIRPESTDTRLQTLAQRLAVTGDLAVNYVATVTRYDLPLQDAVRKFQARHGLEEDGLVGRKTLQALNVLTEERIDQIRLNLDRTRNRLASQADNSILVNVAGFRAYVIRDRKIVWTMKVIVGEKENRTPLFEASLQHIVLNPTWTVPYSIASKEMLPKIKSDPGYLASGGYQLFNGDGGLTDPSTVDWSTIHERNFPFTIVQQPGPANQLGQIKFIFPNDYSVCMHDTPSRRLFAKASRTFSHGCIRVDEPIDLAEVLLAEEGWTRARIDAELKNKEPKTVVLSEPLPVVVSYWTAEVDDRGVIRFYEDIYERDAGVLKALDRRL